jgi:ABC-type branched-subunit amino acid transport system ATPase component
LSAQSAVLHNLTLDAPAGALVVLTGGNGCGTSSLLAALLGEMRLVSGSCRLGGQAAFVPQQHWVINDSIRWMFCTSMKHILSAVYAGGVTTDCLAAPSAR